MKATCPKCNSDLPEQDGLEYRFCPRCGAEITVTGAEFVDDFQTIPPDLNHTVAQHHDQVPEPERVGVPSAAIPNQTLEPAIAEKSGSRPEIVPPPGAPPTSFYRADSPHPSSRPESMQDKPIHESRNPIKPLIIIGAITILMGAILYLLLVF